MTSSEVYDRAHNGDVEGVRTSLATHLGAINEPVKDGYALLHVASMFGFVTLVQFLLDRFALVNIEAQNESRATPLHLAVAVRLEVVAANICDLLINNGAELNAKQNGGQTALHHAVGRGSLKLVRLLIDAGADPFLKDDQGVSPSDLAKNLNVEPGENFLSEELKRAFSLPLES